MSIFLSNEVNFKKAFLFVISILFLPRLAHCQGVDHGSDSLVSGLHYIIAGQVAFILFLCYILYRRSTINKKQAAQLKALDDAKSRFFANISHDLRSPMTLIKGGIQQILSDKDIYLNNRAEKLLKVAQINSERIIHMTNEINELAKLDDDKLQLNLKYIHVERLLNLFKDMFDSILERKGVSISVMNQCFEEPIILVDPMYFEKVIFNLVTNAIKHTKEGDEVRMMLTQVDNQLMISVTDTGEGISQDKLPYIFERYYQAPNKDFNVREGFGIGLALVKEIIEQHGGNIEVYSEIGKGSTFVAFLNLSYDVSEDQFYDFGSLAYSEAKSNLYKDVDDQPDKKDSLVNLDLLIGHQISNYDNIDKKTILIVEDHPEIREHIKDIVSTRYNVLLSSNGIQALKVLKKQTVDMVITDLMMPWLDGFELLENLREDERLKRIPALVLSARTSNEDKQKVLLRGVNDFLCKPFNPNELLTRVENLLEKKEIWNNGSPDALFINNKETLDDVEKSLLRKVEQIILDRIDDPNLSVGYLADQIAVSERKYYRLIKKLTNITPFEHIREIRLQLAMKLIKEKEIQNASEVAKSVGINNVTHFNSQFQKRFGRKPMEIIS